MGEERSELLEIIALTREFALAELRPHSEQWDHDGAVDEGTVAQLAELGFLGMLAPESAGGMGMDRTAMLSAVEQLAWGEASTGMAVALHAQVVALLARHGSEGARQWLPALAAGELIGCAQAATDENTTVQALPSDGGWLLRGSLPWVGNARPAGLLALLAAADAGPLLCLIPVSSPGIELRPPVATMGLRPLALRALTLHDVTVAEQSVLSGPARPAAERAAGEAEAALYVAAVAVGIGQAALEHARDYANVREQFGCKLREFEGIQHKLADMAVRVAAARALLYRAASDPGAAEAALAKVAAAEAAMYASTQAVQVFGGYGYMRDYPVEKLMRDAKAMSLLGGADELHRGRIAERLYSE